MTPFTLQVGKEILMANGNEYGYDSYESDVLVPIAEEQVDTRAGFLVKTYLHLLGAIAAFIAIECVVISLMGDQVIQQLGANPKLCGGILLALCFGSTFIGNMIINSSKTIVGHYIALGFYILVEVAIFVPILAIAYKLIPDGAALVNKAAIMTGLIFTALTATVFILRRDFSFLRGFLIFGSIAAFGLILCSLLFGFTLGVIFTYCMIALACLFILYDTSNVMLHCDKSMYVVASIELFTSIMLLFFYILRLFLASRE